jgi:LacI family transcriptional regulator
MDHSAINRQVTIKQVAQLAGVSTQTVSRVINGRPDVSNATREKVQKIINELGYRPNILARSLITRQSGAIGVVIAAQEFYGPTTTLVGINQRTEEMGYSLLLSFIRDPYQENVQNVLDDLISRQVEGIIWAVPEVGNNRSWLLDHRNEIGIPIIFLTMNPRTDISVVAIDNYKGAKLATTHLVEQGCKKIGMISGPGDWWEAYERKIGWEKTLTSLDIPPNENQLVESDWSAAGGMTAFEKLLNQCPDIDGIFACNDQIALGVMKACSKHNLRIPQQISLVGFDDSISAPFLFPSLSSVQQPLIELGASAVQELTQMINDRRVHQKSYYPKTILLQPTLMIRDSSIRRSRKSIKKFHSSSQAILT